MNIDPRVIDAVLAYYAERRREQWPAFGGWVRA